MQCPKCNSENVSVEMLQTGGKTKNHGNRSGRHINNEASGMTAMCTLVIKRPNLRMRQYVYVRIVEIRGNYE